MNLTMMFWVGVGRLCARKAIECSVLGEMFCRILEDKNVEGDAGNGGLACEVSVVKVWCFVLNWDSAFLVS